MTKDAANIDVVKTVNRCMFDKRNEKDYLGCNVWLRDESRDKDMARKNVNVILGFSSMPQDIEGIVEDIKDAMLQIYESVESITYSTKEYPKKNQYEIVISMICIETIMSEQKVNLKNEEEQKQRAAETQEALKKRIAEEEALAEKARLEKESASLVDRFAEKLAKCKTIEQLDEVFDEVESLEDEKKFSADQVKALFKIYEEAMSRIESGIKENDDSLFMRIKYERQIHNAKTASDIERIRKFIHEHMTNKRMDLTTYKALSDLLNERSKDLQKIGDAINEYKDYEIKNVRGHYAAYKDNKLIVTADTFSELCDEIDEIVAQSAQPKHVAKSSIIGSKIKDIDTGYAIVKTAYYAKYGNNAYVERLYQNLDEARRAAFSLSMNDGIDFTIVDCSTKRRIFDALVNDISPRKNESKEDFISRFMSATKEEYPDIKQRLAVAYSYWNKR